MYTCRPWNSWCRPPTKAAIPGHSSAQRTPWRTPWRTRQKARAAWHVHVAAPSRQVGKIRFKQLSAAPLVTWHPVAALGSARGGDLQSGRKLHTNPERAETRPAEQAARELVRVAAMPATSSPILTSSEKEAKQDAVLDRRRKREEREEKERIRATQMWAAVAALTVVRAPDHCPLMYVPTVSEPAHPAALPRSSLGRLARWSGRWDVQRPL